jgi:biopolymer transport protein ExbD
VNAGPSNRGPIGDLNVTPMIDVLLVLLVIFMLFVPMVRRHVDLQIPVPRERPSGAPPAAIVLEIGRDLSCRVNGQPVPRSNLVRWLGDLYAGRPDKKLYVQANGDLLYEQVIGVFDDARAAGVLVIGVVIPESETGPG